MPRRDTLHFFAGDTVYILTYLELGSWGWGYRGRAGSGDEFWSGSFLRYSGRHGDPERPAITIAEGAESGGTGCGHGRAPKAGCELPRTLRGRAVWWLRSIAATGSVLANAPGRTQERGVAELRAVVIRATAQITIAQRFRSSQKVSRPQSPSRITATTGFTYA